jgi:selenocysteine lyase/cysteine desulfurase
VNPVFLDNVAAAVTATSVTPRNDARRIQWFEHAWANVMGFGVAVRSASAVGIPQIWDRISMLAAFTRRGLQEIDGVELRDRGTIQSGLVTFTVDGVDAPEVRRRLSSQSINISHATVNSAPHDMTMRGLSTVCRASPHAFNTTDEVLAFLEAVAALGALSA